MRSRATYWRSGVIIYRQSPKDPYPSTQVALANNVHIAQSIVDALNLKARQYDSHSA
jgi:hypothetical protein